MTLQQTSVRETPTGSGREFSLFPRREAASAPTIAFGPFRLLPRQRLILEHDRPIRLGSRALDILIALIERRGELISKRELMAAVWPDTTVVEANLTVHVTALRRALGDGEGANRYIHNSPGRGYRFVAPVEYMEEPNFYPARATPTACRHNLPARLSPLIGRGEAIAGLVDQLTRQRLITIVGPGGVGKTAVALDVAEAVVPAYEHGVWLVDLATIANPLQVPAAVAAALNCHTPRDAPLCALSHALRDSQMLILLDNCEHVIEAVAALVSMVLKGSRGVQILATSREPLRIEGERIVRLPPLVCPEAPTMLGAAEALSYSAVQLLVERSAAAMNGFALADSDAAAAGEICRRLDGLPLAIELAALRVETLGVRGVAACLDERLRLLAGGRRAATPRHHDINTALDWSLRLLSRDELAVLRRLASFDGSFTLDAACAEACDPKHDFAPVIADLVTKSLVSVELSDGDESRFRLLETTRAGVLSSLVYETATAMPEESATLPCALH